MAVFSSNGEQYDSPEQFSISPRMPVEAPEKPAGASKSSDLMGGSAIDREHHVPLVASALTDKNGDMYGMAIDHRIPAKPEYEKHLWDHEAYENEYMNHLTKIGYSSQDAYHKAHDWSTQRESAAVEAEFGKEGLEAYKQHWRDASSIASEPTDKQRHPDAHTTKHGLDESELGAEMAKHLKGKQDAGPGDNPAQAFLNWRNSGKSWSDLMHEATEAGDQKAQLDLLTDLAGPGILKGVGAKGFDFMKHAEAVLMEEEGKSVPEIWRETGTFKGAEGLPRQEIPDISAELKLDAFEKPTISPMFNMSKNPKGWEVADLLVGFQHSLPNKVQYLDQILDHPELFKAYPMLRDLQVVPEPKGSKNLGVFNPNKWQIRLATGNEEDIKSTLLHEIQHAVQELEGFKKGSSPEAMKPYVKIALKRQGIEDPLNKSKFTKEEIQDYIDKRDEIAFESYRRVAGEVEARNVQRRADMSDLQREFSSPQLTQEFPHEKQLNAPGNKSLSANVPKWTKIVELNRARRELIWPPEKDEQLKVLHAQGLRTSAIASKMGVSDSHIDRQLKRLELSGAPQRPQGSWKPSYDKILDNYMKQGLSAQEIAVKMDFSKAQIHKKMKRIYDKYK